MNRIVTPAVTTPRATVASRIGRRNRHGRGRTATSRITAAQASRSQTTRSGPISPSSGTDSARPSWTVAIEPTAISVPARAGVSVAPRTMVPVNTNGIVRVHVRLLDILFMNRE
jgi:hypothetical protein